MLDITL